MIKFKSLELGNESLSLTCWSPGMDTLSSSWFIQKPWWINFMGIPYHLLMYEVMASLCCCFGMIKELARVGPVLDDNSGARVLVDRCDVRKVSSFIPLMDLGGVVYPIRVVLDIQDICIV